LHLLPTGDALAGIGEAGTKCVSRRVGHKGLHQEPKSPKRRPSPYYTWAELLKRVLLIGALTCPHCHGPRRLLAAFFDPEAITKVLASLGLPSEPPEITPARPPPQAGFGW